MKTALVSLLVAVALLVGITSVVAFPVGYNPPKDLIERLELLMRDPQVRTVEEKGFVIKVGESFKPGFVAFYGIGFDGSRVWRLDEWQLLDTVTSPNGFIVEKFRYIRWRFVEYGGTLTVFRTEALYSNLVIDEKITEEESRAITPEVMEKVRTAWQILYKAGRRI